MAWIAAVATVGSALIGANAASNAADTQADAANNATAASERQYNQTRADYAPYREAGYSALSRLSDLLGLSGNTSAEGYGSLNRRFTGADLESEPGYQFGLNEGRKALEGSAAARGGLYSGATAKALTRYGTDYASTKYGDAYNRFNADQDRTFNRLSGVAGTGQTATNSVTAAGQQYSADTQSNLIGAGNARASGYLAGSNALVGGINQGAALFDRYTRNNGVGSGSTLFNDPTDPYGYNATNGSDAGFYISDVRLKTNIRRIGTTARGNPSYRWDWIDGSGSAEGVIAQEVAHIPGAVRQRADGVLTVDYSKV